MQHGGDHRAQQGLALLEQVDEPCDEAVLARLVEDIELVGLADHDEGRPQQGALERGVRLVAPDLPGQDLRAEVGEWPLLEDRDVPEQVDPALERDEHLAVHAGLPHRQRSLDGRQGRAVADPGLDTGGRRTHQREDPVQAIEQGVERG